MNNGVTADRRDFLGRTGAAIALWRIPEVAFVLAFLLPGVLRNWIWIVALLWMGGACLVNAIRCGRRHCYVTGPLFLLGAIGLVFYQARIFGWPDSVPVTIALVEAVGGLLLIILPERAWGRYVNARGVGWRIAGGVGVLVGIIAVLLAGAMLVAPKHGYAQELVSRVADVASHQQTAPVTDISDVSQFQTAFNADDGTSRLVLLLSPT